MPARLASLGFRGVNINGTPALVPPLITIPAGPFLMGSDKTKDSQASNNELPQHRVEVAAFQIVKYPVTVAEYALAVRAGAVAEPSSPGNATWAQQRSHPDHPVVCVSLQDAARYIAWLATATGQRGWRLPTEAEWEKAARWDAARNVNRIYPWGDTFDKDWCNTSESGIGTTSSVGSYPATDPRRSGASAYGVEEMAGNVWESSSSWANPYPYSQNSERENRTLLFQRTVRGGAWQESGTSAERARAQRVAIKRTTG
jgi:formylglycine-generating enzyme required for sulfatase activity